LKAKSTSNRAPSAILRTCQASSMVKADSRRTASPEQTRTISWLTSPAQSGRHADQRWFRIRDQGFKIRHRSKLQSGGRLASKLTDVSIRFGPEKKQAWDMAGDISLTDAPYRNLSLKSIHTDVNFAAVFTWNTSESDIHHVTVISPSNHSTGTTAESKPAGQPAQEISRPRPDHQRPPRNLCRRTSLWHGKIQFEPNTNHLRPATDPR
jgi:hypothetical protein